MLIILKKKAINKYIGLIICRNIIRQENETMAISRTSLKTNCASVHRPYLREVSNARHILLGRTIDRQDSVRLSNNPNETTTTVAKTKDYNCGYVPDARRRLKVGSTASTMKAVTPKYHRSNVNLKN